MRDFSAQAIPSESTVGDMYESTDVKMLRYYIFTKRKADQCYDSDEMHLPKLKSSKNLKAKNRVYSDDEDSLPELELSARKLQTSDEGKSPNSPGFELTKGKTTPTLRNFHTVEEKHLYSLPDLEIPVKILHHLRVNLSQMLKDTCRKVIHQRFLVQMGHQRQRHT